MWICAKCGTEAQQPEICSGCGSSMKPFDSQPAFAFVLLLHERSYDETPDFILGPFPTVMEADQWWEAHCRDERFSKVRFHAATLVERP